MVDSSAKRFIQQGDEYKKQAEKKRKGSTFGNIFYGKADRERDALELYEKAANCYKSANQKDLAVECLL